MTIVGKKEIRALRKEKKELLAILNSRNYQSMYGNETMVEKYERQHKTKLDKTALNSNFIDKDFVSFSKKYKKIEKRLLYIKHECARLSDLQNQFSSNTEVHVIDFFEVPISHVSEILVIPETFEPLKAGFEHYWITPHINRYGQCLYDVKFKGLPSFRYYTIYEIVNFCRNDKITL